MHLRHRLRYLVDIIQGVPKSGRAGIESGVGGPRNVDFKLNRCPFSRFSTLRGRSSFLGGHGYCPVSNYRSRPLEATFRKFQSVAEFQLVVLTHRRLLPIGAIPRLH